jgi:hypothetical protein
MQASAAFDLDAVKAKVEKAITAREAVFAPWMHRAAPMGRPCEI